MKQLQNIRILNNLNIYNIAIMLKIFQIIYYTFHLMNKKHIIIVKFIIITFSHANNINFILRFHNYENILENVIFSFKIHTIF